MSCDGVVAAWTTTLLAAGGWVRERTGEWLCTTPRARVTRKSRTWTSLRFRGSSPDSPPMTLWAAADAGVLKTVCPESWMYSVTRSYRVDVPELSTGQIQ